MKTPKIHWIGSAGTNAWQRTACGIEARATKEPNQYDGWGVVKINANYRTWVGVTCRGCLRNPHAPGGRYANLATAR